MSARSGVSRDGWFTIHSLTAEVEAKDLVAERIPLSVAVEPSSYDIFPEAQESMSGSSSDSDSDGSASGDDDTTALGDTSDGSTECPGESLNHAKTSSPRYVFHCSVLSVSPASLQ